MPPFVPLIRFLMCALTHAHAVSVPVRIDFRGFLRYCTYISWLFFLVLFLLGFEDISLLRFACNTIHVYSFPLG